jgi:hypothetical protein
MEPDGATKRAFTDGGAPNQVFHFNIGWISYGTDDKGHAASLILSLAILALLFIGVVLGMMVDRPWMGDTLKMLGSAFLIVAGIAIGKSSGKNQSGD